MLPQAVNTNHRCIWHGLVTICDASFEWLLRAPSLGGGSGGCMGLEMGPMSTVQYDDMCQKTLVLLCVPVVKYQCADLCSADNRPTTVSAVVSKVSEYCVLHGYRYSAVWI